MFLAWYLGVWNFNEVGTSGYGTFNKIMTFSGDAFMALGFITSFFARCALTKLSRRQPGGSTFWLNVTLFLNIIGNLLGAIFHMAAAMLLGYWGLFATSSGSDVGTFLGGVILILALIFLLNGLFFVGQLMAIPNVRRAIKALEQNQVTHQ